jgi:hypothetical protein
VNGVAHGFRNAPLFDARGSREIGAYEQMPDLKYLLDILPMGIDILARVKVARREAMLSIKLGFA